MSRGHPDWNVNIGAVGEYLRDHAELAVRLGSPYTYERIGKVVAFDMDGVQLTQWDINMDGTDAAVAEDTTVVFVGDKSLKLTPGSDGGEYASIERIIPYVEARNVGVSLIFASLNSGAEMRVTIKQYIGGTSYSFQFKVTGAGLVQYMSGAVWVTLFDTTNDIYYDIREFWHVLHCSVDLTELEYKSVQLNHLKETIGVAYGDTGITPLPDGLDINIQNFDDTGDQDVIYVDAIVITVDEP